MKLNDLTPNTQNPDSVPDDYPPVTNAEVAAAIPYAAFLVWVVGSDNFEWIWEGLQNEPRTYDGTKIALERFLNQVLVPARNVVAFCLKCERGWYAGVDPLGDSAELPTIDAQSMPWVQFYQHWLDWTDDQINEAPLLIAFDQLGRMEDDQTAFRSVFDANWPLPAIPAKTAA